MGQPQQAPFDRREQYEQIASGLMPGEIILAVYDATGTGTGFLGLTDRRVIIQDKSFVGKTVAISAVTRRAATCTAWCCSSSRETEAVFDR